MRRRDTLLLLTIVCGAPPAFAEGPGGGGSVVQCGPHERLVVEKDDDEGSTVKRCVCEAGWDAGGPAPPCRKVPAKAGQGKRKGKR